MRQYHFLDDYSEGAHPEILNALSASNLVQQSAYGADDYSAAASRSIAAQLGPDFVGEIHFVASGTMANIICIASCLRPYEAVIAVESGHIVAREAGAIEATGHKLITVPAVNGKITPAQIEKALQANAHFPHMAKPKLVYLSNATETGTVYTLEELQALSALAKARGLYLFMDGARLGAALASPHNDATLQDIAALVDLFWIGGTKLGALLGEAIVVSNPALVQDFAFHIKQRGGMLAKGRVLGIQFQALFGERQWFTALATHANQMAARLSAGIVAAGGRLASETETNQVFAIVPDAAITALRQSFAFYVWGPAEDGHSVVRLVTSWATDADQVEAFIAQLTGLL
ncbi:threonine aldolase family protein [Lampropedia aestuarii]|uniref:threonine aldolase family protein n=1 Tax=Lampropedia aestuarii TaxID=2562762 RepID=UPI002469B6A2|nr:aminotransferase class I/II-fold pyridoxal phosphate-dependent enzyme [Lampropedia aestuarii]MDH5858156.1 aminotransferase class I/II-fold pyridoxal phosphate-dependent enzyme [Lampropedia aestuarii]